MRSNGFRFAAVMGMALGALALTGCDDNDGPATQRTTTAPTTTTTAPANTPATPASPTNPATTTPAR